MLITNDASLDAAFKSMRNQGRGTSGAWLQHEQLGFNYRLADINCALGISQLSRIDEFLAARRRVAGWYRQHLGRFEEVQLPVEARPNAEVSWFVYVIRLAPGRDRDAFMQRLRDSGVACANYFSPIHLQGHFEAMGHTRGEFPITEAVASSTVALPFYNNLREEDVRYVASAIDKALAFDGVHQTAAHSLHRPVLQ